MTTLVAGATGATGQLLVRQLLMRGQAVKAIVRSPEKLPADIRDHGDLSIIHASILELSDAEMAEHISDCQAIASCLGHTMSFRGIYGQPRRLVTDTTRRLCQAIISNNPDTPVRCVLMNTAGNSNRDISETVSWGQRCVIGLLRWLVPPHGDNEQAADYLRTQIGQPHPMIEWAVVRPDTLIDEETVSELDVCPSPTRSAIFDPGQTSRINVAAFMADLVINDETWHRWRGQMPVIYNTTG